MHDPELVQSLTKNLEAAYKRMASSTGKSASGAESSYGQAYQELVRIGVKPQLRLKYRSQGQSMPRTKAEVELRSWSEMVINNDTYSKREQSAALAANAVLLTLDTYREVQHESTKRQYCRHNVRQGN